MTIVNDDRIMLLCSPGEAAILRYVLEELSKIMACDQADELWEAIGVPGLEMVEADYHALLEIRDAL